MSILDNYYGEGKSIREKIEELEQENRRLSEKNKIYSNALVQEKEKNRKLSEGKIIYASEKEQRHYVDILEENQKLKEEIDRLKDNAMEDMRVQTKLEEENQKLKKNIERYEKEETRYINKIKNLEMIKKENESQISCYFKERDELREENQTLKDNVEFLHSCLDDRDKSIEIMKEENKKLKEKLSEITMVSDDEKQSIEHILELEKENKNLKKDILFRNNRISWFEGEEERLNSVINTLKKKLENSVGFWKKKVAKLSEENRQLKHRNEVLDLSLKTSVHPLVYNELVGNTETSKSTEGRNS